MVTRTESHYVGIVLSLKLAIEMRPLADEIASRYRNGRSYEQIANELFPSNPYRGVVKSALRKLLHGHPGGMGVDEFEGTIPKEELIELERRHKADNGNRLYSEGIGIHALEYDERSKSGKVGGRISGRKAVEEKTGIHALTREERAENSRKLHESRGLTPWRHDELVKADNYSQIPQYRRDFDSLASRLNVENHQGKDIRDAGSLRSALARFRRSQKKR